MKVTFIDSQKREFEVDIAEDISDSSMLQYQGSFYVFRHLNVAKAYRPVFQECKPPQIVTAKRL